MTRHHRQRWGQGSGFRVQGPGFRVQGLGFGVDHDEVIADEREGGGEVRLEHQGQVVERELPRGGGSGQAASFICSPIRHRAAVPLRANG